MSEPRQPPYSVEAEQSVLGGLMLWNESWHDVAEIVTAEDFYRLDHQLIFSAIGELIGAGKPCDMVTLSTHLTGKGKAEDAGGFAYIARLCTDTPSVTNVRDYAGIVAERALLRRVIGAGWEISDLGYAPSGRTVDQLVNEVQAIASSVEPKAERSGGLVSVWSMDDAYFAELHRRAENRYTGTSTGYRDIDRRIIGLEAGDWVIVAARPSIGKTVLGLNIAENIAMNDEPGEVLFYALEMPTTQLKHRQYARMAGVRLERIRAPHELDQRDHDSMVRARGIVRSMPLLVDETAGISIRLLRARALRRARKGRIKAIVVDYVQLITGGKGQNRTTEMGDVSRSMKALAKECGCPIIGLAQLNRASEGRDDKRPKMAELRESGDLEQDADIIALMYRDEIHVPDSPHKGVCEVDFVKVRNGCIGKVELGFEGAYSRFIDYNGPGFVERVNDGKSAKPQRVPGRGFHDYDD